MKVALSVGLASIGQDSQPTCPTTTDSSPLLESFQCKHVVGSLGHGGEETVNIHRFICKQHKQYEQNHECKQDLSVNCVQ